MKITSFNPMIVTKDLESVVAIFEALGFEKSHNPIGTSAVGNEYTSYRMTDQNGFHVDVSTTAAPMKQDLTGIRMNVDDFDEAYRLLVSRGFKNFYGEKTIDTKSAKSAVMISASGFAINLVQHIKKG